MSPLVESIWISGGTVMNLKNHQQRYMNSIRRLYPYAVAIDLKSIIDNTKCFTSDVKCRIIYTDHVHSIEYIPYLRNPIYEVKIVEDDSVCYDMKYVSRPQLDQLYAQRNSCDEIIIVKNDLVTDGYYYNLVFEDDFGLYTPSHPLLAGTMRQKLLEYNVVIAIDININEITNYKKIHFINALNPIGCLVVDIANVL